MINKIFEKSLTKILSLADFERKENSVKYKDFHLLKVNRLLDYIGNPQKNQISFMSLEVRAREVPQK